MSATELAHDVLRQLVEDGVTEVVVAPGSRNAPLSFAAWEWAAAGGVRLHTRIDERSAGFLAVGLARSHRRTAVVCTSGTAVANLHPAALEAAHAALPVAFVTADRPARMRGTDANQTTDQVGIFGRLLPTVDLDAPRPLGLDLGAGPVHLDVQLDEPLLPVAGASRLAPLAPQPPAIDEPLLPVAGASRLAPLAPQPPAIDEPLLPVAGAPRLAPLAPQPPAIDEPLLPVAGAPRPARPAPRPPAEPEAVLLPLGPRTVVVAGDDAGPAARRLAERAGWPLLAEPSSGSRTGEHALRCYRLLLDGDLGRSVERVVVLGRPTLSRPVTRLLGRDDVEVHSVPPRGAWRERSYPVDSSAAAYAVGAGDRDDPAWLEAWLEADRAVGRRLDALLAAEADLTPYEVAGAVHRALAPSMQLVVGASNPVRDLDLMARPTPVGERRKVVANRGLAGIDGTVSTAIGAALGRPEGPTLALMGDVTFLHDSNGLVLGPSEPRPDLTVVVVNDDGGSIFSVLEQGAPEHADRFEALFGTPHHVDLGSLCAATRTPYTRVGSLPELEQVLASPNGGVEVVEVPVRRDTRRDLDARIRSLRP